MRYEKKERTRTNMIRDGGNRTGGSMGNLGETGGDGEEERRGNKGR